MSKSLVTLLDNALFPAGIMILSKFLGVVLTIRVLNIPWTLKEYTNSLFSVGAALRAEDIATVTSYSDLVMYMSLAIFFSFSIIQAIYLHNSHVKPTLVLKLSNRNLLNLIKDSYEIYHSSVIWLIFTWIANVLIIVNTVIGRTYPWIAIACTISSVVLTTLILQDVHREIDNIKKHPGQYTWQ